MDIKTLLNHSPTIFFLYFPPWNNWILQLHCYMCGVYFVNSFDIRKPYGHRFGGYCYICGKMFKNKFDIPKVIKWFKYYVLSFWICIVKRILNVLIKSYFLAATRSRTRRTRRRKKKKKSLKILFFEKATHKYISIFYMTNSNKLHICVKIATQNIH